MSLAPQQLDPSDDATVVPADPSTAESMGEYLGSWWKRVRGGESGVLPVLLGLVIIVVIFQTQKSVFLSALNLTNLLVQGAAFVLLGMAEVFVLLLGEIDLSVGFVAALGAFATVWLSESHGWSWGPAIAAGLILSAVIGAVQGLLIVKLGLPSFVVTLAGLLGWQGVLILAVDHAGGATGGTLSITNGVIGGLVSSSMPVAAGWIVMILAVVVFAAMLILGDRSRRRAGLVTPPLGLTLAKIVALAVAGTVLVLVCNRNRGFLVPLTGVPWAVPVVLVILVGWTVLLSRTRFGRYVYAIGGNAEAARRAGVNLGRMRVACFALCSLTAGAGGIVYASRLGSISDNVNGGQLVLFAVAAAVIGGTSLFGGQGKMLHALLGGLVIATIYNGMGLINLSAALQLIVTALVLLAAVTVDAVARRGQTPN
jgi:D-xylose transport system permease protein